MPCSLLMRPRQVESVVVRLTCHHSDQDEGQQPHLVGEAAEDLTSDIGRPATYLKVRVRGALLPGLV